MDNDPERIRHINHVSYQAFALLKYVPNCCLYDRHMPPHSVLDLASNGRHWGCKALKQYVLKETKPNLHVFGMTYVALIRSRCTIKMAYTMDRSRTRRIRLRNDWHCDIRKCGEWTMAYSRWKWLGAQTNYCRLLSVHWKIRKLKHNSKAFLIVN